MAASPHSVLRDWDRVQQSVSIFHKLLPQQSPGKAGQANCPYVFLNERFRFHPTISEMTSVTENRKLYNKKKTSFKRSRTLITVFLTLSIALHHPRRFLMKYGPIWFLSFIYTRFPRLISKEICAIRQKQVRRA